MGNEELTDIVTADEMLCMEIQDEAYHQGKRPQWHFNHATKLYWIEIDGDAKEMKRIVNAAKKLVKRQRVIRAAKQALMDTGR